MSVVLSLTAGLLCREQIISFAVFVIALLNMAMKYCKMRLFGSAFGIYSRNLVPFNTIFLPNFENFSLAKYVSSIVTRLSVREN